MICHTQSLVYILIQERETKNMKIEHGWCSKQFFLSKLTNILKK
jgi:hypothetical protein